MLGIRDPPFVRPTEAKGQLPNYLRTTVFPLCTGFNKAGKSSSRSSLFFRHTL